MINAHALTWLTTLQRRAETAAAGNRARLAGARTLAAIVQLGDVPVPAELRAVRNSIPGLKQLSHAVGQRLDEILSAKLKELSAITSVAEAKKQRGVFMTECEVLRGKYATYYRRAYDESGRILHQLERSLKSSEENPDPSQQS